MELGEFVIPKRYYFVTYTSPRDLVLRPGETKTVTNPRPRFAFYSELLGHANLPFLFFQDCLAAHWQKAGNKLVISQALTSATKLVGLKTFQNRSLMVIMIFVILL